MLFMTKPSIKAIQVRHEAAGGFMAMAHALSTGEPAVCYASQGPGIANITPAMLESLAACTPVILLGAGVDGHIYGKGAFKEGRPDKHYVPYYQVGCSKFLMLKKSLRTIRRAFFLATNGQPGRVYIEIPPDWREIELISPIIYLPCGISKQQEITTRLKNTSNLFPAANGQ